MLVVSVRKVGALLPLLVCATGAAAQTIHYEQDGQHRTFQFKQNSAPETTRQGELPRGPKNIPWDEPGKMSGIQGLPENPAMSVSEKVSTRRVNLKKKRAALEAAARPVKSGKNTAARATPARERSGSEKAIPAETKQQPKRRAQRLEPTEKPLQLRHSDPAASLRTQPTTQFQPTGALDEPQNRAKIIEQWRASSAAEEQRRLENETRRGHLAQSSGLPSSRDVQEEQVRTTQIGPEPASSGPDGGRAAQTKKPEWRRSICRILFFGALRGC
jgi:hypothetical protein